MSDKPAWATGQFEWGNLTADKRHEEAREKLLNAIHEYEDGAWRDDAHNTTAEEVAAYLWNEGCQFTTDLDANGSGFWVALQSADDDEPCVLIESLGSIWPDYAWHLSIRHLAEKFADMFESTTASERMATALEDAARLIRERAKGETA